MIWKMYKIANVSTIYSLHGSVLMIPSDSSVMKRLFVPMLYFPTTITKVFIAVFTKLPSQVTSTVTQLILHKVLNFNFLRSNCLCFNFNIVGVHSSLIAFCSRECNATGSCRVAELIRINFNWDNIAKEMLEDMEQGFRIQFSMKASNKNSFEVIVRWRGDAERVVRKKPRDYLYMFVAVTLYPAVVCHGASI